MTITKVFISGNSQAVRIPVAFRIKTDEVEIFKRNNDIIIREKPKNLSRAFDILTAMPDDFFPEGRQDAPPEERDF